ncbi:MAG: DNA gyrase subunit A [Patescibacteria group bacterium]|nr:DNA gyrase subunit A [Patescibacteria group bacterium]
MADKLIEENNNIGQLKPQDISEEMKKSYLDYAMSVIVSRALPDVRDGLKPVHRRVLYAMNNIGLRSTAKFRKSATIVGEVLGKYHPHGDVAVYDTIVRMAQDFSLRYPMINGQGNFGSMDGDSAAAMRYTEAKMAKISEEILTDIDKDTVDFVPNYDGTLKEPVVLPSKVPTLLLNGQEGIAVGMATKIPPHNLGELCDGICHLIDNSEATIEDLMQFVKGPDFPTGGVIYDIAEIKNAYGTGKGSIITRAVAEIEEGKKNDMRIVISEIPYQVNKAGLITKIAELVKEKKIQGIGDIRDESDRKDSVRIIIELKKDAYANKILNQLYKLTPMQTSYHVNMLALVDGIQPQVLTLKMIFEEFIKHRRVVVRRRTEFELKKAKDRAHILEGLLKALKNIDAVIKTIKASATKEIAHKNLKSKFKLTAIQAQAILDMRLQALAGLERKKIEDEYKELQKIIADLEAILKNEKKILDIIKNELLEIKNKYGDERRTKVIKGKLGEFTEADLVPNETVIVALTKGNYIKRILASTFRQQQRGGKGVVGMSTKEEDVLEHMVLTHNHDDIMFFTNQGRVFRSKVYEIPMASRIAKGSPIVNFIQLAPEEVVTSVITVTKDQNEGAKYLFMSTKNGTVKKVPIEQFANVRRSGLIAIGLQKGDQLLWVKATNGNDEIIMASKSGLANRFKEKDVRPMGRAARGVRGMRLKKDDQLVGTDVIIPKGELLVIMENGYGKRTNIDEFSPHHRGGVGMKAAVVTPKTGNLSDVRIITELKEDLVVVSTKGVIIRVPLGGISKIGRATQGVRIMRLGDGDKVASVTLVVEEKIEEEVSKEEGLGDSKDSDFKAQEQEKLI